MSNILDIGRSGILAYRTALSVTGENIANAETAGYRRRDAELAEIGGGRATLLSKGTNGQGVTVNDVRRAFDALLAERTNGAGSALGNSQVMARKLAQLEDQMQPGAGGMLDMMDGMFDALTALAQAPDDTGLRRVFMTAGDTFAGSVRSMAEGMNQLRTATRDEMQQAVDIAGSAMRELAAVQSRMSTMGGTASRNPLMDQRDRLIGELSDLTDLSVTFDAEGLATVRFGSTPGGPVLVAGGEAARLTLTTDGRISIAPPGIGGTPQTRQPVSGQFGGFTAAIGAIDAALADLDIWAGGIASDMNAVHAQGLNAFGASGGDLFALDGWSVRAAPINRGSAFADVTVTTDGPAPAGPLRLIRDDVAGVWNAFDDAGTLLGSGANRIDLPGLSITLSGSAAGGDLLQLTATHGAAANMRFMLDDPRQVAAASRLQVSNGALNNGTGRVSATPAPATPSGQTDLGALLGTALSPLDAIEFLQNGVVGVIPAGTQEARLAGLGVQSTAAFNVAAPGGSTTLDFTLAGTAHSVDLTTDADGNPVTAWSDMATLAQRLNDGTLVTATGETLAELGVHAAGQGGALTLAAARGDFTGTAQLGGAGASTALLTPGVADAGTLQVFTREGRQIAGAPLDPVSAAALLTPANGFADGASYSYDPDGYRGMAQGTGTTAGQFTLAVDGGGLTTWTGALPAPAAAAQTLTLRSPAGGTETVAVPEGATAARTAALIGETSPLAAQASTQITLDAPADGTLSFTLTGDNMAPIPLSGPVLNGRLDAVAAAVNAASGQTGITAELAEGGGRLLLSHAAGADIVLGRVTHSASAPLSVTRSDVAGEPLSAAVTLGAGGPDSLRATGQVRLRSEAAFEGGYGGLAAAARDPLTGGLMTVTRGAAGSVQSVGFSHDPAFDGSHGAADGTDALAAATVYTLNLTGGDGTVWTGTADTLADGIGSSADAALAMAASLRETAPASRLTGASLAALPADGSTLAVTLDGQRYDITMSGGAPVVTGPEAGRVLAGFDAANRLVIETVGGSLDGGALRVPGPQGSAQGFGMDPAAVPLRELRSPPLDLAATPNGPGSFLVTVDGTDHAIAFTKTGSGVSLSPAAGFPGTASYDPATQIVSLSFDPSAGSVRIAPQADAARAGFATAATLLSAAGGTLTATATDGRVIALDGSAQSLSANRITLRDLPNEDLLVVMSGPGALNLSGQIVPSAAPPPLPSLEIRVTDADRGAIDVIDAASGDLVAQRVLGAGGRASVAGFDIALTGALVTGDRFHITPNTGRLGDAATIERLGDLRQRDPATGAGGFAAIYDTMLSDLGGQVIAAESRQIADTSAQEGAQRAEAEASAVDLDREAADLLRHQQAYQANAQVVSVARQLFDTLMNAI
jgi:flagellar hook-associated protein 1 FlgK